MNSRITSWLWLMALVLTGCGSEPQPRPGATQTRPPWSTGFWFWNGSATTVEAGTVIDALFVQAGTLTYNAASPELPDLLPPAREYWLVFRYEGGGVPDAMSVPALLGSYERGAQTLRSQNAKVAGMQLDIDAPTGSLAAYGRYLKAVRKGLPEGDQLSITALLDWFRPGTDVARTLDAVDEFVPQFYDTDGPSDELTQIGAPVDARRWGPLLERFGKRYRVGISCFGRVFEGGAKLRVMRGSSLSPLAAASTPELRLTRETTTAGEALLRYEVTAPVRLGWHQFQPGESVLFAMPARASISVAYAEARRMGPHCAGVLFFRWPGSDEGLTLPPQTVLRYAGLAAGTKAEQVALFAEPGDCAVVACAELLVSNLDPGTETAESYVVESSVPLEYFIPQEGVPVRTIGPSRLELRMPAYSGATVLQLGTVVTARAATFRLVERKR
ncbi:MAG: DUF3142 domain-containing protein [Bryobacterales bacterium]|nr:DUF3142 domain-containing protein [Bryobacterales bacterium]